MESTFFTFTVDWKTLKEPLENSLICETKDNVAVLTWFITKISIGATMILIDVDDIESAFTKYRNCCYCSIKGTYSECVSSVPLLLKETFESITINEPSFSTLFVCVTVSERSTLNKIKKLTDEIYNLIPAEKKEKTNLLNTFTVNDEYNDSNIVELEIIIGNLGE